MIRFLDKNNGNAPPGFDTDHLNDIDDEEDNGDHEHQDDHDDDLNNGSGRQWNPNHSGGNYNFIGQRLLQLAQQDGGGGTPPPSSPNFIRPLMQMNQARPPPPPSFFNQGPGPGGPNQGFPGGPMFRPRGGRGNRGGFFRGGPSPRGFNNYRGNNFRGGHRGRW